MLKNIFLFTLGSTSGFLASNYVLQQDIYSTSAVLVQRLDTLYSQLSNISAESRLVESRSKEVSRELDILLQSKNTNIEELKKEFGMALQQQHERQDRINAFIFDHMGKMDSKTESLVRALAEDNPSLLQKLEERQQEEEERM
mmetsp:Transcript_7733/g.28993  ORF Transcript_7733/g.28993 Transcript_7733/m.28993 type:complete len:143 (-) Transcript_7733:1777-2205(-)